jgi:hypothetical protein
VILAIVALVAIEDAVSGLLVLIADLPGRAVDGESRRAVLGTGRAVDPVGAVEERNAATSEVEPVGEDGVRDVDAPLRLEHVERREARAPYVVVAHKGILGWIASRVKCRVAAWALVANVTADVN